MKQILICIIWIILNFAVFANDLETQREIYMRADHALKKHDRVNFERLMQKIPSYPLYPYLEYDDLKQKIKNSKPSLQTLKRIKTFKENYPDFPFITQLREAWLTEAARHKNWNLYLQGYEKSRDDSLQCHYFYARYQETQDPKIFAAIHRLWLTGQSQPKACDALFAAWQKSGTLSKETIWDRLKLAFEAKNTTLAKHLIKQLPPTEQTFAKNWEALLQKPNLLMKADFLKKISASKALTSQMLTQGLRLLAKNDAESALNWWQTHRSEYTFSNADQKLIERDIGVYLAHQKHPMASAWLARLPDESLDATAHEWRIRLALKEHDWQEALTHIKALPAVIKEDKCWHYWEARALSALGDKAAAQAIYATLAQSRGYYGFLASIHLHQPITLQHSHLRIDEAELMQIARWPGIQRFEQLRLVGKDAIARVEWFYALDVMNERERQAAAKIAHNMALHDIAILTLSKAQHKDDIHIRFPLAHAQDIFENADKHNLDPAWVFAIARQESAFFNQALSSANARGLMQLCHPTAQELAKKHVIAYFSEDSLHIPEINIQLGTVYLKDLKERMNNHLLIATAAYNAGPTRVTQWLPKEGPLEADIWIETIPYKETREYVKNVFTFIGIYRHHLGNASSLAPIMKPVSKTS